MRPIEWTAEQNATITALRTSGKSLEYIAREFGVSRWAIVARCKDLGCYGPEDADGNWHPHTTARLVQMWTEKRADGSFVHSASAIGRALTRTTSAVTGKAHRLGLESRPNPVKAADAPKVATGRTGWEALPAGHPATWGVIALPWQVWK